MPFSTNRKYAPFSGWFLILTTSGGATTQLPWILALTGSRIMARSRLKRRPMRLPPLLIGFDDRIRAVVPMFNMTGWEVRMSYVAAI